MKAQENSTQNKPMKCPSCEEVDMLATIEHLQGLAECDSISQEGPEWSGTTDVLYETSKTVGIHCQCGWEYEGDDWIKQLKDS